MLRFPGNGGTCVLLVAVLVLSTGLSGCGSGGKPSSGPAGMSSDDREQADYLYRQMVRENSLNRDDKVVPLADTILARYPSFDRNDEVLAVASEAAANLGDVTKSLALTDELFRSYRSSSYLGGALEAGADLALSSGDSLRGASYRVALYDLDPMGSTGPDGRPLAADLFSSLSQDELRVLASANPGSGLRPYLGFLQVQGALSGGQVASAESVVLALETTSPGNEWTLAARDLLQIGPGRGGAVFAGEVRVNQVGVICPLTGRYAVLGNAFYDAALLALAATNAELGTDFELKLEDSQGDPVAAALAARRLCAEEGSVAILGAMMSDPTAAVAIVADHWQVPMVSPTATNDRIWELGGGIFQTNLTGIFETRLLASLATTVMLKKRFGLLYPDTPEGRGSADVFRAEVTALGGVIVAEEAFPSHSTDFKDSILALRQKRPEVLFVPASVDQMVLLGPQLDFYHAGSLVMGLSNWNSEKLRERSGTVLERAIFPNDLALFPEEWTAEFRDVWDGANYPPEASVLALKSYQATRMLLDTLGQSEVPGRTRLGDDLRSRLANRGFDSEGPESFSGTVRMFRGEEIVPFPGGRFAEAWALNEGAVVDSLALEPVPVDDETYGD